MIAPINTTEDLHNDPQLRSRDYWREIDGRSYPGPFARLSRSALGPEAPPPRLGEANALLEQRREPVRPAARANGSRGQTFEGVRIADFRLVRRRADH